MNCKFCGNEMEEGQHLCSSCQKEQGAPEVDSVAKPKKNSNLKWIIAAAVAVVVLGVVGVLVATGVFTANVLSSTEPLETEVAVEQETVVSTSTAGEFTDDITLNMVDADGVYIPHEFVVSNDLMTQEMASTVVATCGDLELDNETLAYYYYQRYMDMYSEYGSYITMLLDPTLSLSEQMLSETQSIQDMLVQGAVYSFQQDAALYNAAMAEGFTMSQEYASYCETLPEAIAADVMAQGYESAEAYLIDFYGPYATMDSFIEFVTVSMTAAEFITTKTADLSSTEEEILAYYDANAEEYAYYGMTKDGTLVDVRHILITPEDDGNSTTDEYGAVVYSEESWAAAKEKTEALLAEWEAGEATEDSFAALATERTEDPGSAATGGLYQGVYAGQMVANFDAWCFDDARQYGDSGIVESSYGFHIMFYVGSEADNSWYETAAADLLAEEQMAIQAAYVGESLLLVNYYNVALSPSQLEVELAAMYGG